jgi:hypothetical protein
MSRYGSDKLIAKTRGQIEQEVEREIERENRTSIVVNVKNFGLYRVFHKARYTFVKGRISVICGAILLNLGLF